MTETTAHDNPSLRRWPFAARLRPSGLRQPLALVLLAGMLTGTALSGGGMPDEFRYPSVELDMLVFEDEAHYAATREALTAIQEDIDETDDDRRASVFQDFAASLGFESLLMLIDRAEDSEDIEDYVRTGAILDRKEPAHHYIPDTFTRGLLNPRGEIMIGDTIYRYEPNGYYQIENRDLDTLAKIRHGDPVTGGPHATFVDYAAAPTGPCCIFNGSKVKYKEFAGGQRRIKATQWVTTDALGTSFGAETENQRLRNNGRWRRDRAVVIEQEGSYTLGNRNCEDPSSHYFYNYNYNRSRLRTGTIVFGQARPILGSFDLFHEVTDHGDVGSVGLDLCNCPAAVSSFTLPSLVYSPQSLILDGSASVNEDRYFIQVHKVGSNEYPYKWFSGAAGSIDLTDHFFFSDATGSGTDYVVKLAVQSTCTNWHETSRTIRIIGEEPEVTYRVHMKKLGWGLWSWNNETAGTTGQNRRIEAAEIKLANAPANMSICYTAVVQSGVFRPEVCDGEEAGTTGDSIRMEQIRIRLVNAPLGCRVEYRAYVGGEGWESSYSTNNALAGTPGKRIEALQVRIADCL